MWIVSHLVWLVCFSKSSSVSPDKVVKLVSLGRPINPGMLYDVRTDTLVPGLTLWDSRSLQNHIEVKSERFSEYYLTTFKNYRDKLNLVDAGGSLTLSVLSGKFKLTGSAKVVVMNVDSSRHSQVALEYKAKTVFKYLPMELMSLEGIEHPRVLQQNLATHVVTGVQYGADAIMVFSSDQEINMNNLSVSASLRLEMSAGSVKVDVEGGVNMTSDALVEDLNVKCSFVGDFVLKFNPSSFEEAREVYESLPAQLGSQQEKGVPMTVWMIPLSILNTNVAKLMALESERVSRQITNIQDDIDSVKGNIEDLRKNNLAVQSIPKFDSDLMKLSGFLDSYWAFVQKKLLIVLPKLRGTGKGENELIQIGSDHRFCPFSPSSLTEYLQTIKEESGLIATFLSNFNSPNVKLRFREGEFAAAISDVAYDVTVVYQLQVLPSLENSALTEMRAYLKKGVTVNSAYSLSSSTMLPTTNTTLIQKVKPTASTVRSIKVEKTTVETDDTLTNPEGESSETEESSETGESSETEEMEPSAETTKKTEQPGENFLSTTEVAEPPFMEESKVKIETNSPAVWYQNPTVLQNLTKTARMFSGSAEGNLDDNRIQFVVGTKLLTPKDIGHRGAQLAILKDGVINAEFLPVGPPTNLRIDINSRYPQWRIAIKWNRPKYNSNKVQQYFIKWKPSGGNYSLVGPLTNDIFRYDMDLTNSGSYVIIAYATDTILGRSKDTREVNLPPGY